MANKGRKRQPLWELDRVSFTLTEKFTIKAYENSSVSFSYSSDVQAKETTEEAIDRVWSMVEKIVKLKKRQRRIDVIKEALEDGKLVKEYAQEEIKRRANALIEKEQKPAAAAVTEKPADTPSEEPKKDG